jgi:hypothetical protein
MAVTLTEPQCSSDTLQGGKGGWPPRVKGRAGTLQGAWLRGEGQGRTPCLGPI